MRKKGKVKVLLLPRRWLAAALGLLLAAVMLAAACLPELLLNAGMCLLTA